MRYLESNEIKTLTYDELLHLRNEYKLEKINEELERIASELVIRLRLYVMGDKWNTFFYSELLEPLPTNIVEEYLNNQFTARFAVEVAPYCIPSAITSKGGYNIFFSDSFVVEAL
jgi:hypothetical protein